MVAKPFAKFYLPKISGGLSIIGSSIILAEVWKDFRSERGACAKSRILFSLSVGDVLYSL